ncbi:hypothetical protein Pfo_009217 [Paulownia fortunei]|nr:hypothetical protein Pfo_009217 [Paulownia fortunei]
MKIMATPNMAPVTATLERSLQNCSLKNQQSSSSSSNSCGGGAAQESDSPENLSMDAASPTLELNSQISLPFHWEQCLDLKTGEVYFINWGTGVKAKEDPRTMAEYGDYYSEDDSSSYDSEGSSSESSPPSSKEQWCGIISNQENYNLETSETENNISNNIVLVVAGCKSCLMYYMVPKQLPSCPRCCGQLLHFDRSENGFP